MEQSAAVVAVPAQAKTIRYADFSSTAGLQLNGNTTAQTVDGRTVLGLTSAAQFQRGSAFRLTTIPLGPDASFSTAFTFQIGANDSIFSGADGIMFVIQTNSNNVGGAGLGIGYEGIRNSIGIEFDTYMNPGEVDGNHIGVNLNGYLGGSPVVTSPFVLDGGSDLTAFIDYNGATRNLDIRLSNNGSRPGDALLTYANLDLAKVLGSPNAYAGFTSGTGYGFSNHDIINWQFNNRFAPIAAGVPEPATWMMLLLGFGAVGAMIRRRGAHRTSTLENACIRFS